VIEETYTETMKNMLLQILEGVLDRPRPKSYHPSAQLQWPSLKRPNDQQQLNEKFEGCLFGKDPRNKLVENTIHEENEVLEEIRMSVRWQNSRFHEWFVVLPIRFSIRSGRRVVVPL
jgi:hypothetical protein